MQLLIVEDDPVIASYLVEGLKGMGHALEVVANGGEALARASGREFDAIILDRMLPDIPGTEVLKRLHSKNSAVPPVLMLSALGTVENRVEGLEAGADDYLAKPFSMVELGARLNALTRRSMVPAGIPVGTLAVGHLVLDSDSHSVRFRGTALQLNRKEFSLLAILMRHADRLVTRQMLFESVWNYSFQPATNIVESGVSRLRAKLLALDCDPIETKRGAGYLLLSRCCS